MFSIATWLDILWKQSEIIDAILTLARYKNQEGSVAMENTKPKIQENVNVFSVVTRNI